METYGRLPLSFEANHGQTDGSVKFLSRGSGYTLFLTANEAVLALQKPQKSEARPALSGAEGSQESESEPRPIRQAQGKPQGSGPSEPRS